LRIPAQMQRVCAPSPCKPELRSNTRCPESLVGCAFAVARPPRCSLLPFAACVLVLLSCPPAQWVCVCLQPPSLLSRRMALHTAAPVGADTAGKSGVAKADQHHTASRLGRCLKQTGPALLSHGSRRAAGTFAPATWPPHRSPALLPAATVQHLPGSPIFGAQVDARCHGRLPGSAEWTFPKAHRTHRAQLPFPPSLFVFFFPTISKAKCGGSLQVHITWYKSGSSIPSWVPTDLPLFNEAYQKGAG
jgi:hypothetical protein